MHDVALHQAYDWEAKRPDTLWLTQPTGGGAIKTYTWGEAMGEARRMAAHLVSLDLPPKSNIALFSKNSAWWLLADLAIWMAGHVSVPLYPTLDHKTIRAILDHSGSKLIFVGKLDGFEAMKPGIPDDLPVIALPLSPPTDYDQWDAIVGRTEPLTDSPKRDGAELATIVYTSGSTGMPKGVMTSFAGMTAAVKEMNQLISVSSDDRMLSYLPLAHVVERLLVETGSLQYGYSLFFAESLETFVADLARARPTVFVSVPRLWLKFQLGVFSKMPKKKLSRLLKIPIVRGIVGKKVLGGLGLDATRFAISGSAPIPAELIDWYRSLGLELLEAYGMSENFGYSHGNKPGHVRVGTVGTPHPGVECKLSEAGEILVRSPGTMMGYYKEPEMTAAVLSEDGWLSTGDRGAIEPSGHLRITGRVKEIFKTSKGKYVAPAPIENQLLVHDALELACVSGSGQAQPFAMVVLAEDLRPNPDRAAITPALEALRKTVNANVDHHEQLHCIVVMAGEWSIENGSLTPTMKLKRGAIEEASEPSWAGWYEQGPGVVWQ